MNGNALTKTDLAAWRSLIARPDATNLLVAAALYLCSSLVIPFVGNDTLSLFFVAACALFYYAQTRTVSSLIAPAIPAMLLFSFSGTMMLPAAFFALVFGGATGAMLLISANRKPRDAVLLLLPAAAFAAALLLGATPGAAALTLLPLPIAIAAMLGIHYCLPFTKAVASITAVIAALLLLTGGIALAAADLLSVAYLAPFLEALGDEVIATMEESAALYAEMGITLRISETAVRNTIAALTNLSPAIFTVLCMVIAYFTWRTLSVMMISFGALPRMPRALGTPTMSVIAAGLFIVAYLVALIADLKTATLTGAVAQNLALILEPGLAAVGAGALFGKRAQRSCLSVILLAGLVYLVWASPATALAAVAFCGAVHVLIKAYQHAKKDKGEP